MFILTYPDDPDFLNSPVAQFVQAGPNKRAWRDLMKAVWADPRVRLAIRKDSAPPDKVPAKPGAPALAAEVTVALAIIRRLQGWSYRLLASEVDGSVGWRRVCSLYNHPMPTFQSIQGREAQLKPKTLRVINRVGVGRAAGADGRCPLAAGRRARFEPVPEAILCRVLAADQAWFRDRHRAAHHLGAQISHLHRPGAKPAKNAEKVIYRRLIALSVGQASHRPEPPARTRRRDRAGQREAREFV